MPPAAPTTSPRATWPTWSTADPADRWGEQTAVTRSPVTGEPSSRSVVVLLAPEQQGYHASVMEQPLLSIVALVCLTAAVVWARSARYRHRQLRRLENGAGDPELLTLVRSDYRKDTLSGATYLVLAAVVGLFAWQATRNEALAFSVLAAPAIVSIVLGRNFVAEATGGTGSCRARSSGAGGPLPGGAGAEAVGRAPRPRGAARLRGLRDRSGVPAGLGSHGR